MVVGQPRSIDSLAFSPVAPSGRVQYFPSEHWSARAKEPELLTSESVSWENEVGDGQPEETEEKIQDLSECRLKFYSCNYLP